MIPWLVFAAGMAIAGLGTTIAVSGAAVSRMELTRWISQRLRGAAVASTFYSAPGRLLRTANAIGAFGVLMAGVGLAAVLGPFTLFGGVVVVLVAAVPVVSALAFGVPRAVASRWSESIVRRTTPWVERAGTVARWMVPAAVEPARPNLAETLLAGETGDAIQPAEAKMMSGIMAFTERVVRDVMTPRTEVVALEEGATLEHVARVFSESGYSRLPVCRNDLDNIVGMIYAFDLLKATPGGELPIRPVAVTPGSKACSDLLLQLQREHRQLAVVLDEFGGTAGIATLEDLWEELVGEIFDYEEMIPEGGAGGAEMVELDGAAPSHDVGALFGVNLPDTAETIGGMLARQAGRIPQVGERLAFRGLEFDIMAASAKRVSRVAVRRGPVRVVSLRGGEGDERGA